MSNLEQRSMDDEIERAMTLSLAMSHVSRPENERSSERLSDTGLREALEASLLDAQEDDSATQRAIELAMAESLKHDDGGAPLQPDLDLDLGGPSGQGSCMEQPIDLASAPSDGSGALLTQVTAASAPPAPSSSADGEDAPPAFRSLGGADEPADAPPASGSLSADEEAAVRAYCSLGADNSPPAFRSLSVPPDDVVPAARVFDEAPSSSSAPAPAPAPASEPSRGWVCVCAPGEMAHLFSREAFLVPAALRATAGVAQPGEPLFLLSTEDGKLRGGFEVKRGPQQGHEDGSASVPFTVVREALLEYAVPLGGSGLADVLGDLGSQSCSEIELWQADAIQGLLEEKAARAHAQAVLEEVRAPEHRQHVPGASPGVSLYVGDLHSEVTDHDLFEHFNPVGAVASIRVVRDSVTKRSLGYAYVNFHSVVGAARALETMNASLIKNTPCRLMRGNHDPSYPDLRDEISATRADETLRDEEIAREMEQSRQMEISISRDEEIARQLEAQLGSGAGSGTAGDATLGDEEIARALHVEMEQERAREATLEAERRARVEAEEHRVAVMLAVKHEAEARAQGHEVARLAAEEERLRQEDERRRRRQEVADAAAAHAMQAQFDNQASKQASKQEDMDAAHARSLAAQYDDQANERMAQQLQDEQQARALHVAMRAAAQPGGGGNAGGNACVPCAPSSCTSAPSPGVPMGLPVSPPSTQNPSRAGGPTKLVVIDALNVGRSYNLGYACPDHHHYKYNKQQSWKTVPCCAQAIALAIDYFLKKGYLVEAFLPEWAYYGGKNGNMFAHEHTVLEKYVDPSTGVAKTIMTCPSGADDDKWILQRAKEKADEGYEVVVLSNDMYRDHIAAGTITEGWMKKHAAKFSWIGGNQLFPMLPDGKGKG